jgi:hypothetical protein
MQLLLALLAIKLSDQFNQPRKRTLLLEHDESVFVRPAIIQHESR